MERFIDSPRSDGVPEENILHVDVIDRLLKR